MAEESLKTGQFARFLIEILRCAQDDRPFCNSHSSFCHLLMTRTSDIDKDELRYAHDIEFPDILRCIEEVFS